MRVFLAIFFALLPTILLAQIDTEATSNKSEYMYGEVMEVTLKITNTSDEPFSYRGHLRVYLTLNHFQVLIPVQEYGHWMNKEIHFVKVNQLK